ncbi:MAG TPA: plastocyanin/azurin family copper-binding protein [Candidatus Sulfomarinibacteraceae bacterium]|nr:plastocyanin/azurin family copper-binding protein [Candidatus Sulfomarinibacteraceae bacterium]
MAERRVAWLGIGLVLAGISLVMTASALGSGPGSRPGPALPQGFGPGGMMGFGPGGMMGFGPGGAGPAPDPGSPGFVPGTTSTPRVVRIVADDALRFYPDVVTVRQGETITFEVTTMGRATHEFMVGRAADVTTHAEGTAEIDDIAMMVTKSLTYTFAEPGPYGFACHEPGHYEAGMAGTIVVVS